MHEFDSSVESKGRGYVDRDNFITIPYLTANPLGDRIIDAFFAEREHSKKTLTFREFIRVLAHFRPCTSATKCTAINSRIEKLKFAFTMYDLNKNGYITRNEFKVILNMMIGSNITSEQLESITSRTITEGDYEKNGKISFEEFVRAMGGINVEQLMSIRFLD
ncbi:hypothetical protein LOAG_02522 [Loa loa]|uniref:EF hand family protein n=1 Tax=Loa loa TaxID=7209 RepID=A0A1I7VEA7_LOALO|nr:hypothetical protein LOAG_02522 [Loa loa]EFO25965.2 hypothetical protein LOAG_02522 [Loa loa]